MAEKAVKLGRRVGVVCSAASARKAAELLLQSHASRVGKPVEVKASLVAEAFSAIQRGDRDLHDDLITGEVFETR